uniref:Major facilitator superfamily (MFS) profile domain-containing protein n=1 Tax=Acrobeloides nanus TaxID=290746 RepID=A0A914E8D9_9BILA
MTPKNGSTSSNGPTVNFTQSDKSMLNYAVGVGSIIATFPLNWLYTHYGARFVFLFAGVASTVSTLIIPWVASIGIWWIHAARFLQGIAYAANFAGVGIVCSIWAPLKENAIFLAVLTSYTPISSLITNPVAGILCETLGWPSVYYAHAAACAILFILWFLWYSDEPQNNKNVSEKELEEIHKDKSLAHIKMDSFVPYWEICKNPIVLTVWLNSLAGLGTLVFLYMYGPTYFANVLKFGIAKTGILGSLTVFLSIIVRLHILDEMRTQYPV